MKTTLKAKASFQLHRIFTALAEYFRPKQSNNAPVQALTTTPNIHALLLHLCNQDHQRAKLVMRWLAYPLRNPGAKMRTALYVRGVEGAGSSLFFEQVIAKMYGERACVINHQFSSRFNEWATGKLFVLTDEFKSTRDNLTQMKRLVSSDEYILNRKGLPDQIEKNEMNFVFIANRTECFPYKDERRFIVLEPSGRVQQDLYRAVAAELDDGGVAELYRYLTTELDMADFNQYTSI